MVRASALSLMSVVRTLTKSYQRPEKEKEKKGYMLEPQRYNKPLQHLHNNPHIIEGQPKLAYTQH